MACKIRILFTPGVENFFLKLLLANYDCFVTAMLWLVIGCLTAKLVTQDLAAISITQHIRKKNGFSCLVTVCFVCVFVVWSDIDCTDVFLFWSRKAKKISRLFCSGGSGVSCSWVSYVASQSLHCWVFYLPRSVKESIDSPGSSHGVEAAWFDIYFAFVK